jgi:hypothetical protein
LIPPDVAGFLDSGPSILVGTCSAEGVPSCGYGLGVRADGGRLWVFLPVAFSAGLVADLRATGEIATTCSRPGDHQTVQLKGRVLTIRDGDAADRAVVERHRGRWIEELERVGTPRHSILRVVHWPCHAVEFEVREIFSQTPGPGAGAPWVA